MSDSIGSVSVDVVPDARGWSEKLRAQIRDQTAKVNTDADTGEAEAKLDKVARTRTARVKVNVDKNPLEQGAKSLDSFIGKLGLLPALAITAGAALIPLAGALGGVVAALSAPLAIAGGGATLFAVLGGAAVKQTIEQSKNVDKLKTSVDSARQSLENARRSAGKNADTSASVANAQERLNEATGKYQTALKGVSPQQRQFIGALTELKSTFAELIGGPTGRALLQPFTDGLGLLSYTLRAAGPVIRASAGAFSTLLGDLQQGVASPGFSRFMTLFSRQVGGDIVGFGRIIGNIGRGLGGLLLVLDKKAGTSLVDQLVRLTGAFADWANSDRGRHAVQGFLDYFHKVGPQVADTIGSVARGIGHIVAALAPLGPPVLRIIEGISDALSGIPVPVLTALAAATGGLVAFQKVGGLKLAGSLLGGTSLASKGPLSSVLGSARPIPVFVTNPGFGGPGTPGGGGVNPGVVAAEAGGAAATAGRFARLGAGLSRLLEPLAFLQPIGLGSNHSFTPQTLGPQDFKQHFQGATSLPSAPGASTADILKLYNTSPSQARALLGIGPIRAASTAFDALKAHAATASRQIDLIGPHTAASTGVAIHSVGALQAKLNSLHDKKIQVIAQTASAIASLQRLQAMQIADKSFNVYQHNQIIERVVGPGGGHGISNPGGSASGGGAAGGGSGGGSGRTPVHIHFDENGRRAFTGFMDEHYHENAQADRAYDDARAGR